MFLIRRFDPEIHHRRSIRLRGFDYTTPGQYFVTVCALDRNDFFGFIEQGVMKLNLFGRIAEHAWNDLPNHNPHILLDAFVIMPDHVHGIIIIRDIHIVGAGSQPAPTANIHHASNGAGWEPAPTANIHHASNGAGSEPAPTANIYHASNGAGSEPAPTDNVRHGLPEIIRQFKTFSARRINEIRDTPRKPVWQRNYYEHIIRSGVEIDRIRKYIQDNPGNLNTENE